MTPICSSPVVRENIDKPTYMLQWYTSRTGLYSIENLADSLPNSSLFISGPNKTIQSPEPVSLAAPAVDATGFASQFNQKSIDSRLTDIALNLHVQNERIDLLEYELTLISNREYMTGITYAARSRWRLDDRSWEWSTGEPDDGTADRLAYSDNDDFGYETDSTPDQSEDEANIPPTPQQRQSESQPLNSAGLVVAMNNAGSSRDLAQRQSTMIAPNTKDVVYPWGWVEGDPVQPRILRVVNPDPPESDS